MLRLRLKNSIDTRKAMKIISDIISKPITYKVDGTDLLFNDQDDLDTVTSILSNRGIFNMVKKTSGKVFLTYTELQELKQFLIDKLYTVPNRTEIRDIYTYPELVDWIWKNAKTNKINMKKQAVEIPAEHLKEDGKELNNIDEKAKDIEETVDDMNKEDAEATKKESMNYWMKRQADVHKENRRVSSSISPSGVEEVEIIDDSLANAIPGFVEEEPAVATEVDVVEQPNPDNINPEQSKSQILQQLKVYFLDNFKNDYTYENIVKSAEETGLLSTLDSYDIMGLMNKLAIEVGLSRPDWSQYMTTEEDEVVDDIATPESTSIGYNEQDTDVGEFMSGFDNAPDNLFIIDRIMEERLKMDGVDLEPVVEESKNVVKSSLKNIKKNCSVVNYNLNNVVVDKVNTMGIVVAGKVIFDAKLQFLKKGQKIHKHIELTLPIDNGSVGTVRSFKYVNTDYPLETYFINDLMDR